MSRKSSKRPIAETDLEVQGFDPDVERPTKQASRSANSSTSLVNQAGNQKESVTSSDAAVKHFEKLQQALDKAGFTIFRCISDLGFVGWRPQKASLSVKALSKVTATEIKTCTVSGCLPAIVVDSETISLPVAFSTGSGSRKQKAVPKFPYAQLGAAPLYHAVHQRNENGIFEVGKASLDFYFGCSALEVLSTFGKTIRRNAPCLTMKVPGTSAIMLHCLPNLAQYYSVPGFQFKRLMTGKGITGRHEVGSNQHVQLMDICGYRVLMTAEVDGVDQNGHPVAIMLYKRRVNRKLMFQMIGSGSLSIVRGKGRTGLLETIRSLSLGEITRSVASSSENEIKSLEANIVRGMESLKQFDRDGMFQGGKVYRVGFNGESMDLKPYKKNSTRHHRKDDNPLLPPEPILLELFN